MKSEKSLIQIRQCIWGTCYQMKQKVYAFYRCSYSWKKLNQQAKVKNVKLNKKHWLPKRFNESYLDRKRDVFTSGKETSPKIWSVASEGYKDTENHFKQYDLFLLHFQSLCILQKIKLIFFRLLFRWFLFSVPIGFFMWLAFWYTF